LSVLDYRLATIDDVSELVGMRWDYNTGGSARAGDGYESFRRACALFLREGLGSGRWAVWVAVDDNNQIVSNIHLQIVEKVPKPGRLRNVFVYMTNVYTRPEWRGRGVGTRLLSEACAWSRENDLDFILVWPSDGAVAFYSRQGFRPVQGAMDLHF
jgi:GNAT superfamily N-acetyltransferase